MKYLLPLLLLWSSFLFPASAQNYSCVSPEYKTYFTNSRGYLRGMRIDSVKVINGNTVYYPFLTARTNYMAWSTYADTTGGSWWGKEIIEKPDGTTGLYNYKGDTIHINNVANPGDSWVFFSDTSGVHYTAEVLAIDTQTLGGVLDSIKIVKLIARDANNIVVADSVNEIELRLSKNHGLITAIDFYLFPYRQYYIDWHVDCYFYEAMGRTTQPGKDKLTFNYIDFKLPDSLQIFNYDTGHLYRSWTSFQSFSNGNSNSTSVKTFITDKIETGTSITYTYDFWRSITVYPGNAAPAKSYDSGFAQSFEIGDGLLMDTMYMPEQWYNGKQSGFYYYYFPNDSSFCKVSPKYDFIADVIINNRYGGGGPEPSFPAYKYKEGIGEVRFDNGNGHPDGNDISRGIDAAGIVSSPCYENNEPVSVVEAKSTEIQVLLYPNPANTLLYLENALDISFSVTLYDLFGKKMETKTTMLGSRLIMNVSALPSGMYFVHISAKGRTAVRKVTIAH